MEEIDFKDIPTAGPDADRQVHNPIDLNLDRDTFMTVMSQRKSGKSVLLSNLIYYYMDHASEDKKCHYVYVFSNTAGINDATNHSYKFFDKRAIISPKNMNTFVQNLIKSQIQTKMKFHVLLVFDDIDVSKRSDVLEWLASMGRHYSITVILSAQISNLVVSPTVRGNVDYIFWRKLSDNGLKNNIFPFMSIDDFAGYKELIAFTKNNTKNHQFIFYNNSTDVEEDKIKLVHAEPIPEDYKYVVEKPSERPKNTYVSSRKYSNWGKSIIKQGVVPY